MPRVTFSGKSSSHIYVAHVEKTAAVKKTPRQAASSIESSGRLSFDIPVDSRYVPVRAKSGDDVSGMTSLDDVSG